MLVAPWQIWYLAVTLSVAPGACWPMSETTFFKTVFTPDYREMIAVSQASRRYHFTYGQRAIWLLLLAIYAAIIFSVFYFDQIIISMADQLVGPTLAPWSPIVVAAGIGGFYTWFVCYHLASRLSGRWMEQRSPSQPVSLNADADYISWYSEDIGLWLKWAAIERIYITPIAIAFLVGGMSHYVPLRSFPDDETKRRFIRNALDRMPERARRKSQEDAAIRAAIA
jgi:hypothetical protein